MKRSRHRQIMNEARHATVADNSSALASRIASGHLTRERSCDGKTRFTTYDFAHRVGTENGERDAKVFRTYACPFCQGWHLASVTDVAS